MQKTVTNGPDGWVVKAGQSYYTRNPRSPLEAWNPFPKFAKIYKHKRWAQTMATRLGGQAVLAKNDH